MKIVHINTYDGNGGAGRAVLRLNKGLKEIGIESDILTLYQFNRHSGVRTAYSDFAGKVKAVINIFAERFLIKPYLKSNKVPFSLQHYGYSIANHPLVAEADIIHIHWVNHGFLAPKQIAELVETGKKVVWTLHDSNPITGGCHVRFNCDHYIRSCGNCPVLKNSNPNDLSFKNLQSKKKAYAKLNCTFIAPSQWMGSEAEKAALAQGKTVTVISNALETNIFRPLNKFECREELAIDKEKKVILAGYMPSKYDRHKGLPELLETIERLASLPTIRKDQIEVIFFGDDGKNAAPELPVKFRFAGKISSDELLVKYYNTADLFLMTSLEESMGYTALESIACGTPVAAFRTSGVTDIVKHQVNGFLAELYNIDQLAEGIQWILQHPNPVILSSEARSFARDNFNLETIAKKHQELYESLL